MRGSRTEEGRQSASQPVEGRPAECLISWLASGAGGAGQLSIVVTALFWLHRSLQFTSLYFTNKYKKIQKQSGKMFVKQYSLARTQIRYYSHTLVLSAAGQMQVCMLGN